MIREHFWVRNRASWLERWDLLHVALRGRNAAIMEHFGLLTNRPSFQLVDELALGRRSVLSHRLGNITNNLLVRRIKIILWFDILLVLLLIHYSIHVLLVLFLDQALRNAFARCVACRGRWALPENIFGYFCILYLFGANLEQTIIWWRWLLILFSYYVYIFIHFIFY